jgi:CSLREA domain-containing protein
MTFGRRCLGYLLYGLMSPLASAATFVVTSAADLADDDLTDGLCHTSAGTCTLRAAIQEERLATGPHLIQFNIPGGGVHTIQPGSAYSVILEPVTIDGYSQPGSSPNTLAVGDDAVLTIELDGSSGGANGLTLYAPNCTVQGLVINRFTVGIFIETVSGQPSGGHVIRGNFIGTNAAGTAALGNDSFGLFVRAVNNVIGGTNPADRNVISGNGTGSAGSAGTHANIKFEADFGPTTGSVVQGNYIGTDKTGTIALFTAGSGHGIMVQSGLPTGGGVTIGGTTAAARNVISGNPQQGVNVLTNPCMAGNTVTGVTIQGNFIGVDANGTPLGNGFGGVRLRCGAIGNTIGGTVPGAGNVIAYNGAADFNGNGINADGAVAPTGNSILGNSIYGNVKLSGGLLHAGLGIDLGDDGPTPNDSGDGDSGANRRQNYPVLASASSTAGSTRVQGTFNSTPSRSFRIEVFSSTACDAFGFGEGQTFLTGFPATTDAAGNAVLDATFSGTLAPGTVVTATATDLTTGDTSEFSACLAASAGAGFFTVAPCRVVDTRNPNGPYGGPALVANADRTFVFGGQCGVPLAATAVAINIAVTLESAGGDLRLYPAGSALPLVSAINYNAGRTRANNAIIPLGAGGGIAVHVDQPSGTVHAILDVTGYFQ